VLLEFEDRFRQEHPPPFPHPELKQNPAAEEYKDYMRKKFEYEAWENKIVLLARRAKKAADSRKARDAEAKAKRKIEVWMGMMGWDGWDGMGSDGMDGMDGMDGWMDICACVCL